MIPFCIEEGIGVIPWSPLARGFLAGNRKRGEKTASLRDQHDAWGHTLYYTDADYDVVDRVVEVAKRKGVQPIQVALAWILEQAWRHRADRQRDEARAARSADRGHVGDVIAGRDRVARRAVRPAQGDRDRLARDSASALATFEGFGSRHRDVGLDADDLPSLDGIGIVRRRRFLDAHAEVIVDADERRPRASRRLFAPRRSSPASTSSGCRRSIRRPTAVRDEVST